MPRLLWAAIVSLVIAPAALADDYSWSISASPTDPTQNVGEIPPGVPHSLYLWLECTEEDGIIGMEADVEAVGLLYVDFTALNDFINVGAGELLQLGVTRCRSGPLLTGSITVVNPGDGGSVCLTNSKANGTNGSFNCDLAPTVYSNTVRGFATPNFTPCALGTPLDCVPVSVEPESWGRLKSLYR